jgi:hypothetical protein
MNAAALGYILILVFVIAVIMQMSKDRRNGG